MESIYIYIETSFNGDFFDAQMVLIEQLITPQ